ncbi:hypothetical protein GCM10023189_11020 [Nibrella saemangeumensis]|uniref:HTH LytTR-type domain-containing protein n=1 Tax=Nibrella saemangeumensis TaxID=1084526 RepID=A0ABP8MHH6_9BACT
MKIDATVIQIDRLTQILIAHIVMIEGDGNYSHVVTSNRRHTSSTTLHKFECALPGFIRCHKHTLINPAHVVHINRPGKALPASLTLTLSTGALVVVSRRRADETIQAVADTRLYEQFFYDYPLVLLR